MTNNIWELPNDQFILLCRRIVAARALMEHENRDAMIMRLVSRGLQTGRIAQMTGYSGTTIRKVKREFRNK